MNDRIVRWALYTSILGMTLHDFYWLSIGLPVFTIGAAALYLAASLLHPGKAPHRQWIEATAMTAALLLGIGASALFRSDEAADFAVKAPLGFGLGAIVAWTTASRAESHVELVLRGVRFALAVHVAFWLVQVGVHSLGGPYLDVTGWLGDNAARHQTYLYTWGYRGSATRFTGLMAEPAEYATIVFMLVAVGAARASFRPTLLDGVAIATMLGSLAMTGIGFSVVLVVAMVAKRQTRRSAWLAAGIAAIAAWALPSTLGGTYIVERTGVLESDRSVDARLWGALDYLGDLSDESFLLGRGIGSYAWNVGRGSGLADFLIYVGLVGTILFIGGAAWCFRMRRAGVIAFGLWFAALASPPQQTNPFWWMWTVALALSGRE